MDICPLTGQPCPHKKCIHVTDCGPNYKVEGAKDMCVICGQQFLDPTHQPLPPVHGLFELFKAIMNAPQSVEPEDKGCPNCGCTLQEINQKGKVGCSNCYVHYKDVLEPLLNKLHGSTKHVGKRPSEEKEPKVKKKIRKPKINVKELEEKLKEAIKKEDYEEAAKLRDEIKKLQE